MQNSPAYLRWRTRTSRSFGKLHDWCISTLQAFSREVLTLLHIGPVGRWGEATAETFFTQRGIFVIERNWRHHHLEADLIAIDGDALVLVEVKTRHKKLEERYPAFNAVTPAKMRHLTRLQRALSKQKGPLMRRYNLRGVRIDLVEVYYFRSKWGHLRKSSLYWSHLRD